MSIDDQPDDCRPELRERISIWSMRPQPGTPAGEAWERGCMQGYEWGLEAKAPKREAAQPVGSPYHIERDADGYEVLVLHAVDESDEDERWLRYDIYEGLCKPKREAAQPVEPSVNEKELRRRIMAAIRSYGYSHQDKADLESRADGVMSVFGEYVLPFVQRQPERESGDVVSALRALTQYVQEQAAANNLDWSVLAKNQVLVNALKALESRKPPPQTSPPPA